MPAVHPNKKKRNPSILSSLGITVKVPSAGLPRIVSNDLRVQSIMEARSKMSTTSRRPVQSKTTDMNMMDLFKASRQGNIPDIDLIVRECPNIVNSLSSSSEDIFGTGGTCLHYAAVGCQPGALYALLTRGADPKIRSGRGCTALHVACIKGSVECCVILLDHGASMLQSDAFGLTPLEILKQPCGDAELARSRRNILEYYNRLRKVNSKELDARVLAIADKRIYSKN